MEMTEKEWFEKLSKDREESAKTLEKPSMQGIWTNVENKFSEKAHFVYELLQNADDAKATEACFDLLEDKLIFRHNGLRHFCITDVAKEKEDAKNGKLGDLNSITSIGNSTKGDTSTIGKFGVGFKAVFQYTETPLIYDKNYKFKIERFIVPVELEEDFPDRNPDDTVFVFPFNRKDLTEKEAYSDISKKLRSLVYPELFLNNLKTIVFTDKTGCGEYSKNIISEEVSLPKNTVGRFFTLKQPDKMGDVKIERLWTFSRFDKDIDLSYTVGFFIEKLNQKDDLYKLVGKKHTAFCYFPTKENTGLNFIIHAPFLLNDSRENIKVYAAHNHNMVKKLAELSADSLLYLKDISKDYKKNLINENILDIIPYQHLSGDNEKFISFEPFYDAFKQVLGTEEILPVSNVAKRKVIIKKKKSNVEQQPNTEQQKKDEKYKVVNEKSFVKAKNAYLSKIKDIEDVFADEKLQILSNNSEARWVFSDIRIDEQKFLYIKEILQNAKPNNGAFLCDKAEITFEELIDAVTNDFIESQDFEWLNKFYGFIVKTNERQELVKKTAIFLDEDKKAVPAFNKDDHPCLFLEGVKFSV